MRTEAKLRSITRELTALPLEAYALEQKSKARAMTCAAERGKKCELEVLSTLADDLRSAVEDFNRRKGGA